MNAFAFMLGYAAMVIGGAALILFLLAQVSIKISSKAWRIYDDMTDIQHMELAKIRAEKSAASAVADTLWCSHE